MIMVQTGSFLGVCTVSLCCGLHAYPLSKSSTKEVARDPVSVVLWGGSFFDRCFYLQRSCTWLPLDHAFHATARVTNVLTLSPTAISSDIYI